MTEPIPNPPHEEASEMLWDAIHEASSVSITCGFCARTHFATRSEDDYEEGELEELRRKAAEDPGHYHEDAANDGIAWGTIEGRILPWHCPCGRAARYETFIWENRHLILEYLKARTAEELNAVQQDVDLLNSIPEDQP